MKNSFTIMFVAAGMLMMAACGNKGENVKLSDQQDTLSWAMGRSLAQTAQSGFYDFDIDIVLKGFEATLEGKGGDALDQKSYQEALEYLSFLAQNKQHMDYEQQRTKVAATQGELFAKLAENPDVKKGPEGIYYEVLVEGKGPKATVGKRIKFDFKASLMTTGQVFEQTYGQRDPIVHVLAKPMAPGILAAIQLMNAGSKYRFYIPWEMMKDAQGVPPMTPVIYEIELHEIYND